VTAPGLRRWLAALLGSLAWAWSGAALARPSVQPLFVRTPGAAGEPAARAALERETRRLGWKALMVVEVAAPPPPRAPAALRVGLAAVGELRFADALAQLDRAAEDAVVTGAAGLSTVELADIYLFRGIVRRKLRPSEAAPAWDDFVHAAAFNPGRVLDPGQVPPAAIETWNRAAAEVQRRPHGTLIVRAPPEAEISVDGRPPIRSPALIPGLAHGEHLVRVEEAGRWPWAASVALAGPSLEVEVPSRPEVALDDGAAAEAARKSGTALALVAQQRPGEPLLELRLVDVASRARRAAAVALLTSPGDLAAALDRLALAAGEPLNPLAVAPVPPPAPRRLLPALALTGAVVAGLVAGLLVAAARSSDRRSGFPTTLDLPGSGR
jgi:hypothetical protein